MTGQENIKSGTVPLRWDTRRILLVKMLNATVTGSGGITGGAGAPVAAPTSTNAIYVDTNTGTLYVYYSGAWH